MRMMILIWMYHNSKLSERCVDHLFSLLNKASNENLFRNQKNFVHVVNLIVFRISTLLFSPDVCEFLCLYTSINNFSVFLWLSLLLRNVLFKKFSLSFSSLFKLNFLFFFSLIVDFSFDVFSTSSAPNLIWISMRRNSKIVAISTS